MKPSSKQIGIAAAALLFASCADSWARAPQAREQCGVIQQIDQQKHTLTVLPEKKGQALNLVWKHDTRFIYNEKFTNSASLKPGLRACVYYHSPFFGKPFVTKVVWAGSMQNREQPMKKKDGQ